jgi:hypothetical protein
MGWILGAAPAPGIGEMHDALRKAGSRYGKAGSDSVE